MDRKRAAALVNTPLSMLEFGYTNAVFGEIPAGLGASWYDFDVAATPPGLVVTSAGTSLYVRHGLELIERAGTIVVPSWDRSSEPDAQVVAALTAAERRGARLIGIGSGVFLLAAAGVLDGRRAATHWGLSAELAARHPAVSVEADRLYVDDGNLLTGAGASAGLDLLLHVVRCDFGSDICNQIARRLVAPPHRDGSQAQSAARPVPMARDSRLAAMLDEMRERATLPASAGAMAQMAGLPPRSFNRKFRQMVGRSPYDWLLRERVEIAKTLLEESELSIDQIGARAGFGSTQSFRNAFKAAAGAKPAAWRRARRSGRFDVQRMPSYAPLHDIAQV